MHDGSRKMVRCGPQCQGLGAMGRFLAHSCRMGKCHMSVGNYVRFSYFSVSA